MPNNRDNTHLRREVVTVIENLYTEYRAARYALKYKSGEKWAVLLHEARNMPEIPRRRDELFRATHGTLENAVPESEFLYSLREALGKALGEQL